MPQATTDRFRTRWLSRGSRIFAASLCAAILVVGWGVARVWIPVGAAALTGIMVGFGRLALPFLHWKRGVAAGTVALFAITSVAGLVQATRSLYGPAPLDLWFLMLKGVVGGGLGGIIAGGIAAEVGRIPAPDEREHLRSTPEWNAQLFNSGSRAVLQTIALSISVLGSMALYVWIVREVGNGRVWLVSILAAGVIVGLAKRRDRVVEHWRDGAIVGAILGLVGLFLFSLLPSPEGYIGPSLSDPSGIGLFFLAGSMIACAGAIAVGTPALIVGAGYRWLREQRPPGGGEEGES